MPEKVLWARNVGMEALGSTGSCDSMESISSNHSAFSGDYDHLSKEERECLMFLEETIDSLDNEVDSGLSNDESETAENVPRPPSIEPARIPPSSGTDEAPIKSTVIHKTEDRREDYTSVELNKMLPPKQGYHSFPRIIQGSKDEIPKHLSESKLLDSVDKGKFYGKPKSLTAINQDSAEQSSIIDLVLLPPPEPFRDPQFVDKRRSVTDPTDVRETRLERMLPKLSTNTVYKEAPPAVGHYHDKIPPPLKIPRPLSPNPVVTRLQEVVVNPAEKQGDFKQGPPTAPKPRKLPPHIIIKPSTGGGVISNLDPQQRPRTFSAHDRNTEKVDSTNTKLPHSKEQESARREALQKLGLLQEKDNKEEQSSNKPIVTPKTEQISVSHGGIEHGHKDAYRKSMNMTQQDRPDVLGTSPVQPSVLALHKGVDSVVTNEVFSRKRLSMKSNSFERPEDLGVAPAQDEGSTRNVKADAVDRSTHCATSRSQEKENEITFATPKEVELQTNKSPKLIKSAVFKNPLNMKSSLQEKPEEPIHRAVLTHKETQAEKDSTVKYLKVSLGSNPTSMKTNSLEKGIMDRESPPIPVTASNLPHKTEKLLENRTKLGSSENINMISTSPGKTFSFPRPKDVSIPSSSPEVVLREEKSEAASDKSKRHSSYMESSGEPYLRLPQSSVPGLRQINIKSNTLERSGVGLSSSVSSVEDQNHKGGGSFFKKPLFSGNFLRNSRPRPASLGTGKDFAGMEPTTSEAEVTEGRRSFFFRNSRPAAPVTSVKITPKGSADEHRREALKKLGILKE